MPTNAYCYESWQAVGGDKLSMMLPSPLISKKDKYIQVIPRDPSLEKCPHIAKLYYKIFDRIVEKNNLTGFIEQGPGMSLNIQCWNSQASIFDPGPLSNGLHQIILPGYLVLSSDYDDEVAATLAHEISHILLGHPDQLHVLTKEHNLDLVKISVGKQARPQVLKNFTVKSEFEADTFSVSLLLNAGYNPKYIHTSLVKLTNEMKGRFLGFILNLFFDDGHGSIGNRNKRVTQVIQMMNLQDTSGEQSQELSNAKNEASKLSKSPR